MVQLENKINIFCVNSSISDGRSEVLYDAKTGIGQNDMLEISRAKFKRLSAGRRAKDIHFSHR